MLVYHSYLEEKQQQQQKLGKPAKNPSLFQILLGVTEINPSSVENILETSLPRLCRMPLGHMGNLPTNSFGKPWNS